MDKWTEGELQQKQEKKVDEGNFDVLEKKVDESNFDVLDKLEQFVSNLVQGNFDVLDKLKQFFSNLAQGNFSLPMTYWVLGVLASFVWAVAFVSIKNFFDFDTNNEAVKFLYFLMIAYLVVVYMGIWNSAGKYTGPKVWQIMGKFIVVITAIPIILGALKLLII
ncbi:MAG: hypothetical protein ACJAS1_006326 [Oleiphilaceae bacterium]|jgi:hypothetical protein